MRCKVGWRWVSVVLGLAACGGRYDVGEGAGSAGDGNAGAAAGAGSASAGTGGNGPGSGGADVGSGGTPVGSGGSMTGSGGTAGSASAAGGSAGSGAGEVCVYPESPPDGLAEPAVVWRRISRFLYGEEREPPTALPETTTLAWMSEQVDAVVRRSRDGGDEPPAGLVRFVRNWALPNVDGIEDRARYWTNETMLGTVAHFFVDPENLSDEGHSLLLEPSFLRSHPTISSRGTFIANRFLCAGMSAPVEDTPLLPAQPGETSRQTLERSTNSPVCLGCHGGVIDPFGFALSHYDAAGQYRDDENGLPIDASGNSQIGEFDGVTELGLLLATSEGVRYCLAGQLLNYALLEARGFELPEIHLPIETEYIVCESARHDDSFLRMLQAVVMVPSFSMAGPDM